MVIFNINSKFALSEEKVKKLKEIGIKTENLVAYIIEHGDSSTDTFELPVITAEQLYDIIPWETYIEGTNCTLNVFNEVNDNGAEYIVSYMNKEFGYVEESFSAATLVDALYECLLFCHTEGLLDSDVYTGPDGDRIREEKENAPYDTDDSYSDTISVAKPSSCKMDELMEKIEKLVDDKINKAMDDFRTEWLNPFGNDEELMSIDGYPDLFYKGENQSSTITGEYIYSCPDKTSDVKFQG